MVSGSSTQGMVSTKRVQLTNPGNSARKWLWIRWVWNPLQNNDPILEKR